MSKYTFLVANYANSLPTQDNVRQPESGLPDFSWYNIPKWEKIYQMTTKYTQWPQNILNCRKIDQMAIKYTNFFHCKTLQNLPILEFLV
jgi:hypothetical protein